jgi:hypothetical protein
MALLLALVAVASGALVTYLYDRDAHFFARLAAGACTGLTALGLSGFVFASFLGLTPASLILSTLVVAAPLALLSKSDWRARVRFDAGEAWRDVTGAITRPQAATTGALILFVFAAFIFWNVYARAMFVRGGEIFTGVDNNLGDLPFHLSIITSFAYGENFPPVHTEYAGARLTYPFMVDFIAAMFVRAGATLEGALFWEGYLLALALVVLLYRFALKLTRDDRVAALITPALALLSGGLGWWLFAREWSGGNLGLFELLGRLPHDYTITSNGAFRWGNAVTTLLVPQRGLLLGLPLALVVITQWWLATGEEEERLKGKGEGVKEEEASITGRKGKSSKKAKRVSAATTTASEPPIPAFNLFALPFTLSPSERRMLGAGIVAGLLPLAHAHSFVVLMLMGGCLALLFPRWRAWIIFFAAALLVASPQMWWATRGSAARAESFFGWQFGWDRGEQNALWFWFKNTGLFIPLLVAAVFWRGRAPVVSKRLLLFYLPFTLLFVISNAGKISPWIWDNIKVLYYWYVASVPLVALLIARLLRQHMATRVAAIVLLSVLVLAGALDVWRVVSEASEQREFDSYGVAFAEIIRTETAPRSLILHAPTYNHPVYLTGRRALMGYAGHLWSQGIDYAPREAELKRMYAGAADAESLLAKYGVEYVVVSPLERSSIQVNEQFFRRFTKVGETGGYSLYKIARQ